ncbi:MFS transporter [Pseudomonas syringae pv. actinidiae]|uniref:MFS family permease n=1 Tax=Pseudomonas syringae pv. actinidiae TaxID=103796 RepID=A0AAN4QA43_PSESF|nr:MFS transporter [Pseudomonas syringae]EPN64061.1 major facilitator superfamily protein [Pseudomonas syringae pv. actinidiae ICMP 19079]EPN71689.1 major facilitator superfamily protein [Pseudomonas syringae pv. actinidiae ICMP 19101]AKT32552.1 MFS transporter [Pseudomonas syringae pv. actinidiae ICMP 18884]AOE58880.1 MFS transporter [Pseudomonas syringae pv. actinidiae ICMP 18708]APP99834.1 MFS transporter [Pseudomonas syringae pv. actinidiae]
MKTVRTLPYSNKKVLYIFASVSVLLALSEAVYDLAFANLAFTLTGTTLSVMTTYAIGYSAEIMVTLLGAGFIDRFDKWKLFIATQLVNIIIFSIAVACLSILGGSVELVWFFAFLVDLVHQYARLIMFSFIPFLFSRSEIVRVNGFLSVVNGVARAAGPAIGALVIFQVGLSLALTASIVFMVGALFLALSLYSTAARKSTPTPGADTEPSSFKERFHESIIGASSATISLLRSPQWRGFLGSYSTCVLVISVLSLLWIPFLRDFHEFSPEQTGYLYALGTTGAVLGGLTLSALRSESFKTTLLSAHALMFVGITITLWLRSHFFGVAVGMFLFQFGTTVYFRSTASVIQLTLPKEVIGSWYGAIDFISRFAGLLGVILAGWSYDLVGAYWVYSVLLALVAVSGLAWRSGSQVAWMSTSE